MKAVVVFHGDAEPSVKGAATHPLNRFLAVGFKHCFVCVLAGDYWVRLDGQMGVPAVEVVGGVQHDMASFYSRLGFPVLKREQASIPLRCPMVMNNCTGLVKAVLCIRSPLVQTPLQLYRFLS